MEVSSSLLKRIIKECCRTLSYNDDERQFSFPLYPNLGLKWEKLKEDIRKETPHYYWDDFNRLLDKLDDLPNQFIKQECQKLIDSQLLNGEVLEIIFAEDGNAARLVRMQPGQYLNCLNGMGFSVGKNYVFQVGKSLKTSEGKQYGLIKKLQILEPSPEHIALSKVFIGNYFKSGIANSLWSFYYNIADCDSTTKEKCNEYLASSKKLGINSFTMLTILNAATHQCV